MGTCKVGFAKACITPPMGVKLAGFASETRRAKSVHDDLYTRVTALEFEGEDFIFVQNDLIGVDYNFSDKVKADALEKYGVKTENMTVGATHTHSGPVGVARNISESRNEDLFTSYCNIINETIGKALENKCPCVIRTGQTNATDIATNRNNKDKQGDTRLSAIEFIRDDGIKLLIYNFGCHPTVMHSENTAITADWPYGVANLAEGTDYQMVTFFNGSAGDVSTRFTRKDSTFENVERIGALCYSHIKQALENAVPTEINTLKTWFFVHNIKLRKTDTVETAQKKLDNYKLALKEAAARGETFLRPYESKVEGAAHNLLLSKNAGTGKEYNEIRVQLFKLNDFIFVFVPSELFSALTNPLKEELGDNILIVTYTNGYMGYIADTAAYDAETYEVMTSPNERGQGELLISAIKEHLICMD